MAWRQRSRLVRVWRLWRTRHPRTFNDKVRYKMLRDHRQLMVTFADKAAVRDYIASSVGADHLPRLLHLVADPCRMAEVALPPACVVKPTHGSGAAVLISGSAPADARLPDPQHGWAYCHLRPEAVDRDALVALARSWLVQLYGQGPNREWAYGQVPRQVLVEELLQGPHGEIPDDVKLFVFHGRCRYVEVDRGRFDHRTQDFFTPDWVHLPFGGGHPWAQPPLPRPARLTQMIDLAERLGRETDFVRVDLYDLPDRLVVGELTSLPAGGDSPFDPESWNEELGRHWKVPARYR